MLPNSFSFWSAGHATCGQALSWSRIGPFSVDHCWLQALQFSVHLIDLLSILLRYNGFAKIQKAAVDQTGSRPPNSNYDFFWCNLALGSALELLLGPTAELAVTSCDIKCSFHHISQSD